MNKTTIPWATHTWNPITGCIKHSEGCVNCYAHALASRFNGGDFTPRFHPERLAEKWPKKPARVFVGSMTDIFSGHIPETEMDKVFEVIETHYEHTSIILTKRAGYMQAYINSRWRCAYQPQFIWVGVTAENQNRFDQRVDWLDITNAAVKFVSLEPLLEPIDLSKRIHNLDWVIAGPETGARARPCKDKWIDDIQEQCRLAGVPFFDKRDGADRVRQYPVTAPPPPAQTMTKG